MPRTGRQPVQIDYKQVTALAAQGLNERQIYTFLNIGHTSFYKHKKKHAELTEAIAHGSAQGIAKITNVLFNKAANGDLDACKFYLERKAGWVRQENLHHDGEIGGKHEHTVKPDAELGPVLTALLESVGIHPTKTTARADTGDCKA